MPERIITAIFTTACSNLCPAVICCYAPKQVAEKGKQKFYQSSVWNEAPAYEAVVKVKAGNVEDESRNNKQKNTLGHVGRGGVELVRSWEVAVRRIVWSLVAFGSLTDLQGVTSWPHTKTDGPHDYLQKAQQSHCWMWKSIAMLKGSGDHELLIGKMTNALKPKGKMGDTGAKFDPAKFKSQVFERDREGNARRAFQAINLEW